MITSSADNKYNGTQKRDELHPLSKTDLKAILCGRENSILQNYTNLFRLDGIQIADYFGSGRFIGGLC